VAKVTNHNYSLRSNSSKCLSASACLFSALGKKQKTCLRPAHRYKTEAVQFLKTKPLFFIRIAALFLPMCSHQEVRSGVDYFNTHKFVKNMSLTTLPQPSLSSLRYKIHIGLWLSIPDVMSPRHYCGATNEKGTLVACPFRTCAPTRNRTLRVQYPLSLFFQKRWQRLRFFTKHAPSMFLHSAQQQQKNRPCGRLFCWLCG